MEFLFLGSVEHPGPGTVINSVVKNSIKCEHHKSNLVPNYKSQYSSVGNQTEKKKLFLLGLYIIEIVKKWD